MRLWVSLQLQDHQHRACVHGCPQHCYTLIPLPTDDSACHYLHHYFLAISNIPIISFFVSFSWENNEIPLNGQEQMYNKDLQRHASFGHDFSANAPVWSDWLNSLKHYVGGQIEFYGSFSQIKNVLIKKQMEIYISSSFLCTKPPHRQKGITFSRTIKVQRLWLRKTIIRHLQRCQRIRHGGFPLQIFPRWNIILNKTFQT